VSLICTEVLFGLRIKTLITLNIFGATFGIGGGINWPHCLPWLRACWEQWLVIKGFVGTPRPLLSLVKMVVVFRVSEG